MEFLVDHAARYRALGNGVPENLHVPVAAVDEDAIRKYIGEIQQELGRGSPARALLVRAKEPPPIDLRFPIWDLEASKIFHERMQVWVHVDYTRYRHAYRKAFPTVDISDKILSHTLNRRIAVIKGFQYTRITATSRSANSSAAFSEGWGVELYRKPDELAAFKKKGLSIQYADLSDLMLMMDMKLGGGVMDAVNAAQKLIDPRLDGVVVACSR